MYIKTASTCLLLKKATRDKQFIYKVQLQASIVSVPVWIGSMY